MNRTVTLPAAAVLILVFASPSHADPEQLFMAGISGMTAQSPNSATTGIWGPGNSGHLAAKASINTETREGELLMRYSGVNAYNGFPGGVDCHSISVSTDMLIPHTDVDIATIPNSPLITHGNATWNSHPGPASSKVWRGNFGATVSFGQGTRFYEKFFGRTSAMCSWFDGQMTNGLDHVQLVFYSSHFASEWSYIRAPVFLVEAYLVGDANKDDSVNFDDFLILAANFGNPGGWEQGNFDGDNEVGFTDFLALSRNFGQVLQD